MTARWSSSAKASERRLAGFTLVELIVVIVIIGIAAAVVIPMVGNTGDIQTSAAARQLTSDLMYAQNYAIVHQTRVRVTFSGDHRRYTLAAAPAVGAATTLTHPVTRQPYVVDYTQTSGLQAVSVSNTSFDDAVLEFDSLGAPVPTQGGSVVLTAGTNSKTVTVGAVTGKVSVE